MAIDANSPNAGTAGFRGTRAIANAVEVVFPNYELASFTLPNGQKIGWPVTKIRQDGANRIIERERPYRPGAKLDDTGPKAIRWTMEAVFNNSINEPGLDEFNAGVNLYPDALNDLISIFDAGETADLVVPTVGLRRCKAADYSRTESIDEQDTGNITLVFIEDNEDNVNAGSITAPTINAQGNRLAGKTTFDAQSIGVAGNGLAQVRTFASQLETLVNGPGDALDDIISTANALRHSVEQVNNAFTRAGVRGRDLFTDPTSTDAFRALDRLLDAALRSANEPRRGRPRVVTISTRVDTSLVAIAGELKQNYSDLLSLNPDIIDVLFIPAFSLVKVFADAAFT